MSEKVSVVVVWKWKWALFGEGYHTFTATCADYTAHGASERRQWIEEIIRYSLKRRGIGDVTFNHTGHKPGDPPPVRS